VRAPGPSSRLRTVALLILVGCSDGGASAGGVQEQPWPDRVTPAGPWSASLEGTGSRLTLTMAGTITGERGRVTVDFGKPTEGEPTGGRSLLFPDGERWYPQEPIRLDWVGDVPFVPAMGEESPDTGGYFSVEADGGDLTIRIPVVTLLAAAGDGPVVAHGSFVGGDGREVDELAVPPGTTVSAGCPRPTCETTPPDADTQSSLVHVEATTGTGIHAVGDGEAAVAGTVRAEAEGRSWDGRVIAVEGSEVDAAATYDGDRWSLTAHVDGARQLWVDVWPVVDTELRARSYTSDPGFLKGPLKVEWVNVGHATAQILEAEGTGPGASGVGFDINNTRGHDAGLRVRRGDKVSGFRDGADIDSNLPPGDRTNRTLSYRTGDPATLVLRGNFPEVRVELAVPGT